MNKISELYFVHESSTLDTNVKIGNNTKIWHYTHVQTGARIGENCTLGQNVNVSNNVSIGNGVKIQNNVSIYEGVEIHDFVFCGPSMVFTNDLNPRSEFPKKTNEYNKTIVEYGASIGANATIVCGCIIGKWSMIGAGTVVTKDVPDFALIVGVPGKQIGWVCKCGEKLDKTYICSSCNRKYETKNDKLTMKE